MEVDTDGDAEMGESDSDDGKDTGSKLVCVVHSTGVYHRSIRYCKCPGSSGYPLQLLSIHFFPSSFKTPETVFTFDVLDHFYIDAMECKTSAGSFFTKLRRLTSNAFPEQVPVSEIEIVCAWSMLTNMSLNVQDRYRELMRVSRQWRDLQTRKRFGYGHDLDKTPGFGDLALFCPTCPQPGINLPDGWENEPDE